jgi:hypothetical protein
MKISPRETTALRDYLGSELKGRTLSDARQVVSLTDIAGETCLQGRLGELLGRVCAACHCRSIALRARDIGD